MRLAAFLAFSLAVACSTRGAEPTLQLEAATDRGFYQHGSDNEIYVGIRVTAPKGLEGARPAARNLALVVDRSGSMAGEPVAALRSAIVSGLNALTADDVVAVVAFGSEVETLVDARRRQEVQGLAELAATIEPAGGSALYDALNQAAAQVRRHAGDNTLDHIILVTDGPPTKGPREIGDFAKLAAALAAEGITVSTIGLGPDFSEDMLAAIARAGHGRFHYVQTPTKLAPVLTSEIGHQAAIVARDIEISVEFRPNSEELKVRSWRPGTIAAHKATFRFPRLLAGEPLHLLASAEFDSFYSRFDSEFAIVRLGWLPAGSNSRREASVPLVVRFTNDVRAQRDTIDLAVLRQGADSVIREGLQKAIEQIDRGDARRATRILRGTRNEARDLNFDFEDPAIAEKLRRLDEYLAELQSRGDPDAHDRKLLRSGLHRAFDPPAEEPTPRR